MLSLTDAQAEILATLAPLPAQACPLAEALHRVIARDLVSPAPSPLFTNSAMDGFAIALTESCQLPLRLLVRPTTLAAGQIDMAPLVPGEAIRIMTGAPLPSGADTIVPLEHTSSLAAGQIEIRQLKARGQHVRYQGADFQPGDLLLSAGTEITPGAIGLLAGLGLTEIQVFPPPRVAIISTGDELVSMHETPLPSQLRDSNSAAMAAAVTETGCRPVQLGIARDTPQAVQHKLEQAWAQADVILTLGGVSVGDFDFVQPVLVSLGFEKRFWKVAIKPGKPLLYGLWQGKPVFGIPGNPGSALMVYEQLIRPALRQMLGHRYLWRPLVQARLTEPVRKNDDRLHLLRARLEKTGEEWLVTPLKHQGSGDLLIVSQANGVIVAEREFERGELVDVQLMGLPEDH